MSTFPVIITESACRAFLDNLKSDNSEHKYIRIAIKGGGCSGIIYALDISEAPDENDFIYKQSDVKFVLDDLSAIYLEGTTIDYNYGLTNSGFSFNNPKATRTCGCSKSFSI